MIKNLAILIISMWLVPAYSDVNWAHFYHQPKKSFGDIWVMVIDTGITPHSKLYPYVQYDLNSVDYNDTLNVGRGHGTHVAGIIAYGNNELNDPVCNRVKIFSCIAYTKNPSDDALLRSVDCIDKATRMGMDYINYSGGGVDFNIFEYNAYRSFEKTGGVVVAAAGNNARELSFFTFYPASYAYSEGVPKQLPVIKNIIPVANIDKYGNLNRWSNFKDGIVKEVGVSVLSTYPDNQYDELTGTSQAAPEYLHKLLKEKCNHSIMLIAKRGNSGK